MRRSNERYHLGIFGSQGYGKTTFAGKFIANAHGIDVVFVFDPDGELSYLLGVPPCRTVFELDEAVATGWVCFNPHTLFPGRLEEALEYFAHYCYERSKKLPGRKFFVVDELGMYVTGNAVGKWLKTLVQTGPRVAGINGIFMAQQPNELHNTIRQALTEVVCFQLQDDCALDFPKKFGFHVEAVKSLAPYQFICRNKQGRELRG